MKTSILLLCVLCFGCEGASKDEKKPKKFVALNVGIGEVDSLSLSKDSDTMFIHRSLRKRDTVYIIKTIIVK